MRYPYSKSMTINEADALGVDDNEAADAARYRFLRKWRQYDLSSAVSEVSRGRVLEGTELDAAVDAAIKAHEEAYIAPETVWKSSGEEP